MSHKDSHLFPRINRNAYVLCFGLHPPWTYGEAVVTKSIVAGLADIYKEVVIYSLIDFKRCSRKDYSIDLPTNVSISQVEQPQNIQGVASGEKYDVHLINFPIIQGLQLTGFFRLKNRPRFFFFNMMLFNAGYDLVERLRAIIGLFVAGLIGQVVTTSFTLWSACRFLPRFHYLPVPVEEQNETPFRAKKKIDALYLGNLSSLRFPLKVANAFAILREKSVPFHVTVIAPMNESSRRYARLLVGRVSRLGLTDAFRISVGNLSACEKAAQLRRADVFLYPGIARSAMDPPVSILEAMSCGKTIVGTKAAGIEHIIKGRGIVLEEKDFEAELAEQLARIAHDRRSLHEMSQSAREFTRIFHSRRAMSNALIRIISP